MFPRDFGAHPGFKTEWWYATGWLTTSGGRKLGYQVTFFRSAGATNVDNPSRFAARQLIIGHAALSDPQVGRLVHDQRARRLAHAGVDGLGDGDAIGQLLLQLPGAMRLCTSRSRAIEVNRPSAPPPDARNRLR